ncbi:sulfite exporter TauE/SafE family protein [Nonomuraea roseola]|uniref:Probable membrane transporter protein n=1 Tax=Nonomuraea roseola TaxID=46179 RepID=A0ABV5PVR7_9ACTN
MKVELILLLLAVALAAGWVDAVVGGGGLVQLLALPAAPPPAVLATDKLSSIAGTTVSAVGFARRVRVEARVAVPATVLAVALSGAGAVTAGQVPAEVFRPFVLVTLALVAVRWSPGPPWAHAYGGAPRAGAPSCPPSCWSGSCCRSTTAWSGRERAR